MSQTAGNFDSYESLAPRHRDLRPVGAGDPHGSFFDTSGESTPSSISEAIHRYPDYYFELPREKLVQTEDHVIEVTPENRARAVLTALAETCGGEFTIYRSLHFRENHLKRVKSYLGQTINIGRAKLKRKDALDHQAAVSEAMDWLATQNHPVYQVLTHVQTRLAEDLPLGDVNRLKLDVLTITHWNQLHALYERQVSEQRAASL